MLVRQYETSMAGNRWKSPNIIFPDADLEEAADMAAFGIFFNQGSLFSQFTPLGSFIKDEMVGKLRRAEKVKQGNPLDPTIPWEQWST